MIVNNAASRRDVDFWTQHLQNVEENERAELKEIRGLDADNLRDALLEMQQHARLAPRVQNFMYHADFNPRDHEHLTPEQWDRALEIFEEQRGIPAGQPRVVYEHEKNGRTHRHVIWQRVALENGKAKAFPDGLDWKVAHTAAREIEKELGLERTIGPLDREPGTPRPKRAPEPWEMYRGMKTTIDPRDVTAEVTNILRQSENGADFVNGLQQHGYQFVQGDRAFCILDPAGHVHSLARRIEGMNTKELKAFMQGVDLSHMPTIEQAQTLYREQKIERLEAKCDNVKHEIEREEKLAQAAIEKEQREGKFIAPEDRQKEARAGGQGQAPQNEQQQAQEKKPSYWNRDRANQTWEDAVINAAIEQEKTARQFVDPKPEKETRAGGREKEQQPETVYTSPVDRFKDAGLETAGATGPAKPLQGMEKKLWDAYRSGPNATDLAAALDNHGIAFARVTGEEAHKSYREAQFAKAVERTAPVYREGEIVVVREPGLEYQRNGEWTATPRVHRLDQAHAEKYLDILSLDKSKLKGIDATKTILNASAQDRAAYWQAIRLERATTIRDWTPTRSIRKDLRFIGTASSLGFGAVGKGLDKGLDIVTSLFESLFAQKLTPAQKYQGEKARNEREAQAEHQIDFSKWTADRAQERRNHQEQQAARDRQREIERER